MSNKTLDCYTFQCILSLFTKKVQKNLHKNSKVKNIYCKNKHKDKNYEINH